VPLEPEPGEGAHGEEGVDLDVLFDEPDSGALLAAAPLTALHDAIKQGRLQNGMTALLLACGKGPTWAAACLRWDGGGLAEW